MTQHICVGCNKLLKGRIYRCKKCQYPVCKSCSTDCFCSSCHPANEDFALVQEYRKEKYKLKYAVLPVLILSFLLMFTSTAYSAMSDDLVLGYNMDDSNVSGTTVYDLSTNLNNGTLSGATSGVTGIVDEGFDFDGSADRVTTSSLITINTNYTLSMWVEIDTKAHGHTLYDVLGNNNDKIQINSGAGGMTIYTASSYCGGSANSIPFLSNLTTNTWYNIILVRDGSNVSMYLNGTYQGSCADSDGVDFNLLGDDDAYTVDLDGTMDEVYVWDRLLNLTELSYLAGGGVYPFGEEQEESVIVSSCNVSMVIPCERCRYQNNHVRAVWNCTNTSWFDDGTCTYSINGYSPIYVEDDCTNFTVFAEVGQNVMNFTVYNSTGHYAGSQVVRFYTKSYDSLSFAMYVVPIMLFVAYVVCLVLGLWSGYGFFYALSWVPGLFLGIDLYGISAFGALIWIGIVMGLTTVLIYGNWKR